MTKFIQDCEINGYYKEELKLTSVKSVVSLNVSVNKQVLTKRKHKQTSDSSSLVSHTPSAELIERRM